MARRIIAYLATSADGFIARKDGDVAWLDRPGMKGDYGMGAFVRSVDTILHGRKTWEKGLELGGPPPGFATGFANYVFSRRAAKDAFPGVEVVRGPVARFAKKLRAEPGKDIWMMGGAELIGAFVDAGELDAFIIHVVPAMIGEGIPLLAPKRRDVPLRLRSVKRFPDGVVRLHYDVGRARRRAR